MDTSGCYNLSCSEGFFMKMIISTINLWQVNLRSDTSNDAGIDIESILAFEHCVKHASHVFVMIIIYESS